jgi:hypothetical protein
MKPELMMKLKTMSAISAGTAIGAAMVLAGPGQAAPANGAIFQNVHASQAGPVTEVRWRRRWYRHHHHDHDDDAGAFAAGAIFGLATGAILGNAAASNNAVGYCSRRFRSYDPASGTYLGYDGYRHPCP